MHVFAFSELLTGPRWDIAHMRQGYGEAVNRAIIILHGEMDMVRFGFFFFFVSCSPYLG